jgi:hypothetical protein
MVDGTLGHRGGQGLAGLDSIELPISGHHRNRGAIVLADRLRRFYDEDRGEDDQTEGDRCIPEAHGRTSWLSSFRRGLCVVKKMKSGLQEVCHQQDLKKGG